MIENISIIWDATWKILVCFVLPVIGATILALCVSERGVHA